VFRRRELRWLGEGTAWSLVLVPRRTRPGGCLGPVDTSSWSVVPFVGAFTGAAVNAAIDALPPQSILLLPDGEYSGHLQIRRSETVVRGSCRDPAAVVWRNDGNPQNLLYSGPRCDGGTNHGGFCWNGDTDYPGGTCDPSVAGTLHRELAAAHHPRPQR